MLTAGFRDRRISSKSKRLQTDEIQTQYLYWFLYSFKATMKEN